VKNLRLTTAELVKAAARKFLGERGLDFKSVYTPVTAADLKNLNLSEKRCAGLIIHYYDVKGQKTDFYRFRALEDPPQSEWSKLVGRKRDEVRYIQPTGTEPQAYFPKAFNFNHYFSLPVRDRPPLVITEGEFKADAAAKRGIPCIGLGGVWNYRVTTQDGRVELLPDLARLPWQGMKVVFCYDSDAATNIDVQRAKDDASERLEALGANIYEKPLPQLKRDSKTGLDDFLVTNGKSAWEALPEERWYGPGVPRLQARPKDDFLKHKFAEREEILKSPAACLLRHPSIVQIHAYRGVGKTNVALLFAGALSRKGGEFFRWSAVRALRVLYVEGEQPGADVQRQVRLQAIAAASDNLHVMTLEDQPTCCFPKIVTPEGQKALERYIEEHQIEVLFLDSLSTLANIAMNEEENQLSLGDWFVRLRTGLRVTVVYLQHDGKSGQQRGHSKHEDWIDLSIHLTWAGDYQGAEGLRAHFHIDKARQPVVDGQDMRIEFGPSLENPRTSKWDWKQVSKKEEKDADVLNAGALLLFHEPGMSERAFVAELRKRRFTGSNEKLRAIFEGAKKLRAKADTGVAGEKAAASPNPALAPAKSRAGGGAPKPPRATKPKRS